MCEAGAAKVQDLWLVMRHLRFGGFLGFCHPSIPFGWNFVIRLSVQSWVLKSKLNHKSQTKPVCHSMDNPAEQRQRAIPARVSHLWSEMSAAERNAFARIYLFIYLR
jgi:hypothetical protein